MLEYHIMAILKKIIKVGDSRAIIIPREYFNNWDRLGVDLTYFEMEINNDIVIKPVVKWRR